MLLLLLADYEWWSCVAVRWMRANWQNWSHFVFFFPIFNVLKGLKFNVTKHAENNFIFLLFISLLLSYHLNSLNRSIDHNQQQQYLEIE